MSSSLKRDAVNAVFWVGITNVFSKALSFFATLVIAGLLMPDELGIMAIGWLIIASLGLFREMGLNRAIIYQRGTGTRGSGCRLYPDTTDQPGAVPHRICPGACSGRIL